MREPRAFAALSFAFAFALSPHVARAQEPTPEPLLLTFVGVQDESLVDMNQPAIWIASGIVPLCGAAIAKDENELENETHAQTPLQSKTFAAAEDVVAHCDALHDDYSRAVASEAGTVAGWDQYRSGKYQDALATFNRSAATANGVWRAELAGRDAGLRNVRALPELVHLEGDAGPPSPGFPSLTRSQFFAFLDEMALVATYAEHLADVCKQRIGSGSFSLPKSH